MSSNRYLSPFIVLRTRLAEDMAQSPGLHIAVDFLNFIGVLSPAKNEPASTVKRTHAGVADFED
jgi:hypothetical protein